MKILQNFTKSKMRLRPWGFRQNKSSIMQLSHTKEYPYRGLIFVKGKFRAKIDRLLAQEVRDYWI